jgi:hypothetical protein
VVNCRSRKRALLTTVTGEPLQPIRLYFSVAEKAAVVRTLLGLRCIDEDRGGRRLGWLYQHEAASLSFGARGHADLPPEVHPVVIGELRFPERDRMVLSVRSADRAIEGAKFFKPILGASVSLVRARVVNRWFEASEGLAGPEPLDKFLDANVTRVDPKDAEEAFERAMAGTRTPEEKQRALATMAAERRRRDVPLVEDFPLCPEEETPDLRDLKMTLQLRSMRAYEHWRGNTHLTLADVICGLVEQGKLATPALPGG